jgi:hypothetical protein
MSQSPAVAAPVSVFEQWRPQGDRLTYADAAWCGVAWGLSMHAALHFFSAAIPSLEALLIPFGPAERFAFAITQHAAPIGTWIVLLATQAAYWAVIGVALLAAVRGAVFAVRRSLA